MLTFDFTTLQFFGSVWAGILHARPSHLIALLVLLLWSLGFPAVVHQQSVSARLLCSLSPQTLRYSYYEQ